MISRNLSEIVLSPRIDRVRQRSGKERQSDLSCPSILPLKSPSTEAGSTQLSSAWTNSRSNRPQATSAANPTHSMRKRPNDADRGMVEDLYDLSSIHESDLTLSPNPSPNAPASSFNLSADSSMGVNEAGPTPTPLNLAQLLALLPNRRHKRCGGHYTKASPNGEEEAEEGDTISEAVEEEEEHHQPKRTRKRDNRTVKGNETSHLQGERLKVYEKKREERLAHFQDVDAFRLHVENVLWI
ncbi:hypothetical protein FRC16_010030 [Serendipita sp. 398]|nr:hypothetical protein FRC16_010030 [Serendipita sp. 398]